MSNAERSSRLASGVSVGSVWKRGLRQRKNLPVANGRRFDCGVLWWYKLAIAGNMVLTSRQVRYTMEKSIKHTYQHFRLTQNYMRAGS